jgi:hypothetical protein
MRHIATSSWLVFRVFILSSFWLLALLDSLGVVRFVHFSMLWMTLSYFVVFNLFRLVFFWNDTNKQCEYFMKTITDIGTWRHLGTFRGSNRNGTCTGICPELGHGTLAGLHDRGVRHMDEISYSWTRRLCLRHLKSTQFDGNFIDFFVWRHMVYCI